MSHAKERTYSLDSDIDDFILPLTKYPSFPIPTILVATSSSPTKIPSHEFPKEYYWVAWVRGGFD